MKPTNEYKSGIITISLLQTEHNTDTINSNTYTIYESIWFGLVCPKSENLFFLFFNFSEGGPAQKIAEKIIFRLKKVAKYRGNSLKFALMTFFCFSISRGGGAGPLGPPWTRAWHEAQK